MNKERTAWSLPGIATFVVLVAAAILLLGLLIWYITQVLVPAGEAVGIAELAGITLIVVAFIAVCIGFGGLTPVNPNEARALVFVGHYAGTLRAQGLHWVNPFTARKRISVRVRNFETSKLKVNDFDGNPIEIAAIVVWKVTDTAEALFEVDDYENFVHVQAESALRNLATTHPYDAHREGDARPALEPGRDRRAARGPRSRTVSRRPAWRSSRPASATSPTPPRSPTRCFAASRPTRSSPPARGSSRARSAWSRWPSSSSPRSRS